MTTATRADPETAAQIEAQAAAAHQRAVDELEAAQTAETAAHGAVKELDDRISVGEPDVTAEMAMAARIGANRASRHRGQLATVAADLADQAAEASRFRAEADARALAESARSMTGTGYQQVLEARQAIADAQALYDALRAEWDGQVTEMGEMLTRTGGFDFRPASLWRSPVHEVRSSPASRALWRLEDQRDALLASIPGVCVYPQGGFVVDGQVFTTRDSEASLKPGDLAPNPHVSEGAEKDQDLAAVQRELARLAAEITTAKDRLYGAA